MNGILNFFDVGFADGSFSDCDGQHDQPIPEKISGRQQKMKKILGRGNLIEIWACPVALADGTGVETKKCGLKIGMILARWTY